MRHFDLDRLAFGDLLSRMATGAYTPRGSELLLNSVPLEGITSILNRQKVLTEVRRSLDGEKHIPFTEIPDVDPLLTRLSREGSLLEGPELWDLRVVLSALESIAVYLEGAGRGQLDSFLSQYGYPGRYASEVQKLDDALEPGGIVRDDATPLLARLRKQIRRLEEKLRTEAHSISERWHREGLAQEPEPMMREGRYVVAVRSDSRGRAAGVALDRSRTGQTIFIEPHELSEMSLELKEVRRDEVHEVERILGELSGTCAVRTSDIDGDLERLAILDSAQAASRYSEAGEFNLPVVEEGADLELHRARHPLLAAAHGHGDVVPLTLKLAAGARTLVISGPNAGGKTVALQTVGLCTALAMCGLPVPAGEESSIPYVDQIHVDIGDEQSIEDDLSTYTARLKRLLAMLEGRGSKRLCLMDEAGAGTDPAQGAVLAIAVLEKLTEGGACVVCITHDGRIKAHAAQADGMINGRMVFSDATLTPTYEFHLGEPGRSFAFEIAERSGLPASVVSRARELLDPAERNLDRTLREAESIRTRLEKLERESEINARRAAAERSRYEKLAGEIEKESKEMRRGAAEEAAELIRDARRRIEGVVREIQESKASPASIRIAQATVRELSEKMEAERVELEKPERGRPLAPLNEGDRVYLRNLERPAVVESVDGARVKVRAGSISLDVAADEIELRPGETAPPPPATVRTPLKTVPGSLEIIGYRAEDARREIEKYLDDALLAGLDNVRVIHGSGKGVLRRVVDEVLMNHDQVAEHGVERDTPGGTGVTWVRFKGAAA